MRGVSRDGRPTRTSALMDRIALHRRQWVLIWKLGQRPCVGGHEDWWIGDRPCPWCKAVV